MRVYRSPKSLKRKKITKMYTNKINIFVNVILSLSAVFIFIHIFLICKLKSSRKNFEKNLYVYCGNDFQAF